MEKELGMQTRVSEEPLTWRDKIEGLIFAAILAIGLPALISVSAQ
jgi:hypothetical protein